MNEHTPYPVRRVIEVPSGKLKTPLFMPDATYGFVRSIDSEDLATCRIQAVVMNAFHLMQSPGTSVIKSLGGLHAFSGWNHPIVTDSGGFQVYSLINRNPNLGSISSRGVRFKREGSTRKFLLTPEKSIQLQLNYGSDITICLDYCTHVNESMPRQQESVEKTIQWAERSKKEFIKRTDNLVGVRPLLFAVIQGGDSHKLRRKCAEALLDIGFDGYAYGGYPLDDRGKLLFDMLGYTRKLIPHKYPMIALGVGEPSSIVRCTRAGYDMFDSSLPTRDARQGRLYTLEEGHSFRDVGNERSYHYNYIQDEKHVKCGDPISPLCDCPVCTNYNLAYLHHLHKREDSLYRRLATIHNLRFMTLLLEHLRENIDEGG